MKELIFILMCCLSTSCHRRPVSELEAISEDVIKEHSGVDIKVTPVDVPKEPPAELPKR